jgi:DNA-binding transcriptional LysR family regulator
LHLSQPAVSAHIKAMEDALGLDLFQRTARGMSLTREGERLLGKAEKILAAHRDLLAEAARGKGEVTGQLRLGAGSNSNHETVGKLLTGLAARHPRVEVSLRHRTSHEVLAGIRGGDLDAGFYNEPAEPEPDLAATEVSRFTIFAVAAPHVVSAAHPPDWSALGELAWIFPTESACCHRTAERLFSLHRFRPQRIISADRQEITRTLVASGLGIGLLHADVAREAERRGEVALIHEADTPVRILFAYLASRAGDPLLSAAESIRNQRPRASASSSGC